MTSPCRLVVFDLDGTLIDSRADLCNSINAMLARYGREMLAPSVIAGYIGDGAETLVRRALSHAPPTAADPDSPDDALIAEALRYFLDWYSVHKLDETYVYPGVMDALHTMRERAPNLLMACLTNKPVHASKAICTHFGFDDYFFKVYGGNSFASKKPNPEGLLRLIEEAGVMTQSTIIPAETVMVGDSCFDIQTARNCGARSLGCLFGLAPEDLRATPPDMLVEHASEWPEVLGLSLSR